MRLIDADALETHEQLEPLGDGRYEFVEIVYEDDIDDAPTIEPERVGDPDMVYSELSKVYNMKGLPDEVYSIIGDLMIRLPDAPERKKGKWINKTIKKKIEYDYSCSECGRHVSVTRGYDVRLVYPFCHCGAEMEDKP